MSLQPGKHVSESLRLVRLLGRGAMGSVWLADHLGIQSQVAVKFMSQAMLEDEVSISRFRQEAKAAAEIRSPHVVQVFDHGVTEDGLPYIVMELLEGESLDRRVKEKGPFNPYEMAKVVGQACKALGKAHERGILHRDIKPPNIFLIDHGGDPFVKILDFGVAKFSGEEAIEMTAAGNMVGTPAFMSPEQLFHGKEIDQRGDLWSLAVVTYFALTGVRPFTGVTLGELCVAIKAGNYVMPSKLRNDVGPDIDAWFARAFHIDLEARFSSAKEAAQAFEQAVGVSTVMQSTPSGVASALQLATYGGTALPSGAEAPAPSPKRWPLFLGAAVGVALALGATSLFMGSDAAEPESVAPASGGEPVAEASASAEPVDSSAPAESAEPATVDIDEVVLDDEQKRAAKSAPPQIKQPQKRLPAAKPPAKANDPKAVPDADEREKKAAKTLGI